MTNIDRSEPGAHFMSKGLAVSFLWSSNVACHSLSFIYGVQLLSATYKNQLFSATDFLKFDIAFFMLWRGVM